MCKRIVLVLVILNRVSLITLQSCEYVVDIPVNYFTTVDASTSKVKLLSECISDASFNTSEQIAKLGIGNVVLIKLEKNFIFNMKNLEQIEIDRCLVDTIEQGAFSNVPQLKFIGIYNNRIKTLTRGVFDIIPSLQQLIIFKNKISHIEDHAFANLPNFRNLVIKNNNLDHMKREWFTNTSNIQIFNMEHNLISKIPKGMFHGLRNLKLILLGSNRISAIEDELFENNANIIIGLDLVHNRLTSLSSSVFSDSVHLLSLILSGNLFNYLPEEFLNKIRVSNIYIYGNPFKCSCLEKTEKILLKRSITINNGNLYRGVKACKNDNLPICGFSLNSSDTCIESVDEELTQRLTSYWKNGGYDTLLDPLYIHECAVFN